MCHRTYTFCAMPDSLMAQVEILRNKNEKFKEKYCLFYLNHPGINSEYLNINGLIIMFTFYYQKPDTNLTDC